MAASTQIREPPSKGGAAAGTGELALGPDHLTHLGAGLRAIYREVVAEPMPDRFLQLLDNLAREGAERNDQ